jgi:mRNA-degrading endonuclease RelE of RelBE toxin-antitoxin system
MKRVPVFLTVTAQQRLRHLHPDLKRLLRRALDELASHPMKGKPLQEELAGLWSLRVSHYRVIYQIDESSITVIFLGPRRTVYEQLREMLLK